MPAGQGVGAPAPEAAAADPKGSRQQAMGSMLRMVVASWLTDAAQLAVLASLAGVDAWGALWCLTIGGTVLCAGFALMFALGWNQRLRDPAMTVPHLLAWSAVIITGAAASPEVAVLALSTLFLVFAFGSLRLRPLPALASWLSVTAGIGVFVAIQPVPLGVPMATPLQATLSVIWVSLVLGRCALLGLHGAHLRVRLGQRTRELAEATARLQHLASHDTLTGALNRGAIQGALESALAEAPGAGRDTSIVLVDLDHFKAINDRFGHPVGDEVLRRFAAMATALLPPEARFGRYGGEEFLLVLQTRAGSAVSADALAERLRRVVSQHPWHQVSPELAVSVSMGVATAGAGESAHGLLVRADHSLYRAKRQGRDRVCVADAEAAEAERGLEATSV
jgi:diguanylate cyclase (GGDEF)-like protein